MPRARWFHYLIIFLASMVIAFMHGHPAEPDGTNAFYTWMLIGIWIMFTIRFIDQSLYLRQFNSPHNNIFFILGSFLVAFMTSAWGIFSTVLNGNLFHDVSPWLHVSPWMLVFSLPYLLYSLHAMHACFNKYFLVYVGPASVNARKFAIFLILLAFTLELMYLVFLFVFIDTLTLDLVIVVRYIDPFRLLYLMVVFIFWARYGRQQPVPDTDALIPERQPARARSSPTPPQTRAPRPVPRSASSQRATSTARSPRTPKMPPQVRRVRVGGGKRNFEALRPKAGVLSREDFKCIFCFNLPVLPADEHRGVVLCPVCKHPAHADEFKDWARNSGLCSRCDATFSDNFRRNPKIVPVKTYVDAIKYFSKSIKR